MGDIPRLQSGYSVPILCSCVVDENLASWALFDTTHTP